MNIQVLDARRDTSGGYKVDVGRGSGSAASRRNCFPRPADERYLSLSELGRAVCASVPFRFAGPWRCPLEEEGGASLLGDGLEVERSPRPPVAE